MRRARQQARGKQAVTLRGLLMVLAAAGGWAASACQSDQTHVPPASDPATSPIPKLPANFPDDIPLMPGLLLTGAPTADIDKGTGSVLLEGGVKRADAVAFYDKALQEAQWSQDESRESDGHWLMSFTKNKLKATLQFTAAGGKTTVSILYETQQ